MPKRPTPLSRPFSRPVQPPARAASIPIKRACPEPSPEPEHQPEPLPSPLHDAGVLTLAHVVWASVILLLTALVQTVSVSARLGVDHMYAGPHEADDQQLDTSMPDVDVPQDLEPPEPVDDLQAPPQQGTTPHHQRSASKVRSCAWLFWSSASTACCLRVLPPPMQAAG